MARNYQIGEAVEIIAKGEDMEALQDLGRRYPLLVAKVAKATSGTNVREVVELFSYMPEYLSANKVNKAIKESAGLVEGKAASDDDDEAEEKPVKKAPAKKAPAKKTPAKSADPYEGKDAIELFKECKKRGIKAAAKKTAKFYANLLKKADEEAAAEAEEAEADDDWDDDEDEEPAPKKKAPAKKTAKKPEPEEEEDDDDDDDWDI